jgi:signal transduction histidine kinase
MDIHSGSVEVCPHQCLIYDGDLSAQLAVVVPFLRDGLRDGWQCIYGSSPEAVRLVEAALASEGVDIEREKRRGALVLSSELAHLKEGKVDPAAMVAAVRAFVDQSLVAGFRGLCGAGDVGWEFGDAANFERVFEYEALLDRACSDLPVRFLCQYHRASVPGAALRDALVTHRDVYIGERLNANNMFYFPPELLREKRQGRGESEIADWLYQQIERKLDRDRAQHAVVHALERRLTERTAELDVANRQLKAFSYSLAHDLRAPLRAISGFGAALAEDWRHRMDADGRESLDRMLGAAKRMGDLIEGMLVLGRAVESDLERVSIDLSALAYEVGGEMRDGAPARAVELIVEDGLRAVGDPLLLRVMMTNLLSNAWKFTAQRPKARVEVGRQSSEHGSAIFFVRDNGAGFDAQQAHRLFGMFQRLHRQEDFPGTGVGLATVERIIARHGGRIWAESESGKGAVFFFSLPQANGALH